MYASGPFTRLAFGIENGKLTILIPIRHAIGEKGDLVNTITTLDPRFVSIHSVYHIR